MSNERFGLIAFDPGGTTGVATFETSFGTPAKVGTAQLGPHIHHLALWEYLNIYAPTHIVFESFEFRNKSRDNLELISRNYIGIIELWAQINHVGLYKQSASQAKGFIPDTGLGKDLAIKKLGWEKPGAKHAMDALRHMIYFLVNGSHGHPEIREAILKKGFK